MKAGMCSWCLNDTISAACVCWHDDSYYVNISWGHHIQPAHINYLMDIAWKHVTFVNYLFVMSAVIVTHKPS